MSRERGVSLCNIWCFHIAGKDFEPNQAIIMATGQYKHKTDLQDGKLAFTMKRVNLRDWSLDLSGQGANIVKFINSSVGTGRHSNCGVFWHGEAMLVVHATRHIKKGDELLLSYSVPSK
jgi:hypothetical protein